MAYNVCHFDLAADDVERARGFYESVFGWRFEPFGPPDFYMIFTGSDDDPGIHGSVSKRQGPLLGGGRRAFECTVQVDDLQAIQASILANGGKILLEEYEIVGVGRMIKFEDTEGNIVAAMHYD